MKRIGLALLILLPTLLFGQGIGHAISAIPEGYLIIAPSEYREVLQPLVRWRTQDGYKIEQLYVDSNDCYYIHSLLQERYDHASETHPFARYILLVGDMEQIASFPGRNKPQSISIRHYTDMYYGEFTGDIHPECFVGRLPARDTSEVRVMIDNLLQYEQMGMPDNSYLQRALLVAGQDYNRIAATSTNGTVNYFKEQLKQIHPEFDTSCFYNPTSDTLLEEILTRLREGNGIIEYSGHGNSSGWVHPYLDNTIIDTLSIAAPAIYINNACHTQTIQSDCMGKHLMRREGCGAVGVIGASTEALWNEDYYWAIGARNNLTEHPTYEADREGAIDQLLQPRDHGQRITLGSLVHNGCRAVSQAGSNYDAFYWELYNLFGDPALMPYVGIPDSLPLWVSSSVDSWANEIVVHTLPYAQVAASNDTLLLGIATADSTGRCVIPIKTPDMDMGQYTIKATLRQHIPTICHIEMRTSEKARLALVGEELRFTPPLSHGDTLTMYLKLRNKGLDTVSNHTLTLQTSQGEFQKNVNHLAPDSTIEVTYPIIYHIDTTNYWRATLEIADTLGSYATHHLCHEVSHDLPAIVSYRILNENGAVQRLQHNSDYKLQLVVNNPLDNTCTLQMLGENFSIAAQRTDTIEIEFTTPEPPQHHFKVQPILCLQNDSTVFFATATSWWIVEQAMENFESGSFSSFPWDTSAGQYSWHIVNNQHKTGAHCARSGNISGRRYSRMQLIVECNTDDSVSFWIKMDTEGGCDKLNFYIDGLKESYWSGYKNWRRESFALSEGRHTLQWEYSKDDTGDEGNDCAWVDAIELPLCRWESPFGDFDTAHLSITHAGHEPNQQMFIIGPNPTQDLVRIKMQNEHSGELKIFNRQGILMDIIEVAPSQKNIPQTIQYSTTHLRSDMYLVVFESDKSIICKKLLVIH